MVVTDRLQADVLGADLGSTVNMEIDSSNMSKLMMILSENLYSDAIGSLIRETVSNALDSHREAQNNEPIIVSLIKENDKFVFSVQDFGVGLSPQRVEQVFSKYLSSTKENSSNQLGYYGIGSKSPLAYRDNFTIISNHDNVEYTYMMFKGDEGTKLSLLNMEDKIQANGVTIKVPLKFDSDYTNFINKMKSQLAYFEGVYFKTEYDSIDNDFTIYKSNLWKHSTLNKDQYLHLILDNVYYPIDFNKLGINPIKIPIGLSFSLSNGFLPTPNRENIIYTPNIIDLIKSRIYTIVDEFKEQYNQELKSCDNFITLYKQSKNDPYITICNNIVNLSQFNNLTPKLINKVSCDCVKELDYKKLIKDRYISNVLREFEALVTHRRGTTGDWYNNPTRFYFLKEGEEITSLQRRIFKYQTDKDLRHYTIYKSNNYHYCPDKNSNDYYDDLNYYYFLDLENIPEDKHNLIISEFRLLIDNTIALLPSISTIVSTPSYEAYLEEKKRNRKKPVKRDKNKLPESLTIWVGRKSYNTSFKPIFEKEVIQFKDMQTNFKKPVFYTLEANEKDLYLLFNLSKDIKVVYLTEPEYKKLEKYKEVYSKSKKHLSNWIKIEDYLNNKITSISTAVTEFLVYKGIRETTKLNYVLKQQNWFIPFIDERVGKEFIKLKLLIDEFSNLIDNLNYQDKDRYSDELYKVISTYYNNKWVDIDSFNLVNYCNKESEYFNFLQILDTDRYFNYYDLSPSKSKPNGLKYKLSVLSASRVERIKVAKTYYYKLKKELFKSNTNNIFPIIETIINNLKPKEDGTI